MECQDLILNLTFMNYLWKKEATNLYLVTYIYIYYIIALAVNIPNM